MLTVARCPVRIDLAGGTTDIWPLPLVLGNEIVTVNVALDLPATAGVSLHERDPHIRLVSHDQDLDVRYEQQSDLVDALDRGSCPLPLLGLAAAEHSGGPFGMRVETRAQSPEGAGLGGSSALLVALVGALSSAQGVTLAAADHLALAQDIETALVQTPTGFQDYYPPLYGGCLALRRHMGGLEVTPLPVDLDALAARLRIVYTGVPHHSGITNWGVVRAVFDGNENVTEALRAIGANGADVNRALQAGDLDAALQGVLADGRLRTRLGEGVVTPPIAQLDAQVRDAGALGTKVLGAGGGGCVLVVLDAGDDGAAVDAAIDSGPWQAIPARLTGTGLTLHTERAPELGVGDDGRMLPPWPSN